MYKAGVTRISVSLNAVSKEVYEKICRPKFKDAFEAVLKFVEKAKKYFEVEVTAVKVPELDVKKFKQFAESLGVLWRLREYIQPFY